MTHVHLVMRFKRRKAPHSHILYIVVAPSSWRGHSGRSLDRVGFLSTTNKQLYYLNTERIGHWLNKGVSPTPAVLKFLTKCAVAHRGSLKKIITTYNSIKK